MLAFVSVYHFQKQKSWCFSDFNDFSEINNWKSIEKFGNVVNSPVELSHFPVIIKSVHCLRESHTMEIYSFTGLVYLVVTIQVQLCFCSYFIHLIYIVACVRLVGFGLFLFLCFPFKRIPFTYAASKRIYEKYIIVNISKYECVWKKKLLPCAFHRACTSSSFEWMFVWKIHRCVPSGSS